MENISNLDLKSWAIIIPCGLIALFGLYKILRQSISLMFWAALVIIGSLGVGYVLKPDMTRQVVSKIKSGDIKNLISEEHKEQEAHKAHKAHKAPKAQEEPQH